MSSLMGSVMPQIAMLASMSSASGRVVTHKSFQRSCCGEEFDDYVFEGLDSPFPFSPVGASSRDLPELWKDRRFKLHYRGKWREGRVCGFRQYNPTPSCMETCWQMDVQLDTVEPGDQVEVNLVGIAKRTTTRTRSSDEDGIIQMTTNNQGEFTIQPSDSTCSSATPRMKLHVHRLNVEGGGTVKFDRENETEPLLSLEWLEPASPSVNLFEKIVTFDCPICRATESVMAAFEPPTKTTQAACPICMETTQCRVLSCGHSVCDDCWGNCRLAATRVRLELDDLNESDVMKERAKRDRLFRNKRNRDGPRNDFVVKFDELVERADTTDGLKRIRWEFMVENPALWTVDDVISRFSELPSEALQIIFRIVHLRKDEIPIEQASDACYFCCYVIALELRQAKNYREAVPWAELSLFFCHRAHANSVGRNIASAYLFSSQIYAVADLLTKSLLDFEKCLTHRGEDVTAIQDSGASAVQRLILDYMKEWKGTSGNLTPGI